MPVVGPYQLVTSWFVTHEGLDKSKLDMMVHECEPLAEDVTEPEWLIRDEARRQAIHAMWQIVPQAQGSLHCYRSAQLACRQLNYFVIPRERREFERAFKEEVDHLMDLMTADRKGW